MPTANTPMDHWLAEVYLAGFAPTSHQMPRI